MSTKLGQNFLIDKNIAIKEVNFANISKNDIVLEIGPGNGILTNILAEKAKKVIAVEIDKKLAENLVIPDNVEIINKDILKVDFDKISKFNKIVSNLPYQISSPITFKILNYKFDLAVLIYQKEFADRLIAQPGSKDYSRLSVNIFYKANCKMLDNVSKTCFIPQPKVDSRIIRLIPRDKPAFYVINEEFFKDLVKILFNHRRKKINTIINNNYNINLETIPFLENRVEDLSPKNIGKLCNLIYKKIYG